jgi:phage terminase small subunit
MTSAWEKTAKSKKRKISLRHEKLVDFYFGISNFNKSDAIRRAGYKQAGNYTRIFDHPRIAAEVERRHKAIREKHEITYETISEEMAKIAFSSVTDYMTVTDDGDLVFDFNKIEDGRVFDALGEVSVETYIDGYDYEEDEEGKLKKVPVRVKRIKVKPHSKLPALEALMKHAGLSKDKTTGELADLASRIMGGKKRLGMASEEDE